MDIIAFGMGMKGRRALPFLEKDYHIMFLVDNDESKWGAVFKNYLIKSPDEIKSFDCKIVITVSGQYARAIVSQLEQIGVNHDRIYFYNCLPIGCEKDYELCPLNPEKVLETGIPLIQYDLYNAEERETNHKKVLIFCAFFSVYAQQLIENILKRYEDIEFSLIVYKTYAKEYQEKISIGHLKHIYCVQTMADLKTILEALPVYDAMQLLWIEMPWAYFYKLIKRKTRKLNLNVGGSDFYRATENEKKYKRRLVACADCITAETEETMKAFAEYYHDEVKDKMSLLPFGIEVLDYINNIENTPKNVLKKKFNIPLGKIVVTCGHNAKKEHQHMQLIEALKSLPADIKKRMVCIFPMTYPAGYDDYINDIKNNLKESGLEYMVFTKFMNFQEMAEYAMISNIMIHVQTTDQLSSTMLEEMYTESVVIAGKWLPYKSLHEKGMFFLDVDTLSNVTDSLENVIKNLDVYKKQCIKNKQLIWKQSSWDELAPKWYNMWN